MPASRAACITWIPRSRLIRSYVRHDPSASLLTWRPLWPRAVRGTEGTLTLTA